MQAVDKRGGCSQDASVARLLAAGDGVGEHPFQLGQRPRQRIGRSQQLHPGRRQLRAAAAGPTDRPRHQRQYGWGTPWDGENCNMASGAMLLDRHTLGQFSDVRGSPRSNPPNMRYFSGDRDFGDGTTQGELQTAWEFMKNYTLSSFRGTSTSYVATPEKRQQLRDQAELIAKQCSIPIRYLRSSSLSEMRRQLEGVQHARMWQSGLEQRLILSLRDRKGGDMDEWPADLRVREWPEVRR